MIVIASHFQNKAVASYMEYDSKYVDKHKPSNSDRYNTRNSKKSIDVYTNINKLTKDG